MRIDTQESGKPINERQADLPDLTGLHSGKLTVIKLAGVRPTRWECSCECGNSVTVRHSNLHGTSKPTRSCGCLVGKNGTHLGSRTREYNTWAGIIARCENPKVKEFKYYGARGIKMCERWRRSFEAFLADMGPCPPSPPRWTIERNENAIGYEPGNCRWATYEEQQNNRRNNHHIEHAGQIHTLAQWSVLLGLDRHTILNRIKKGIALDAPRQSWKGK